MKKILERKLFIHDTKTNEEFFVPLLFVRIFIWGLIFISFTTGFIICGAIWKLSAIENKEKATTKYLEYYITGYNDAISTTERNGRTCVRLYPYNNMDYDRDFPIKYIPQDYNLSSLNGLAICSLDNLLPNRLKIENMVIKV